MTVALGTLPTPTVQAERLVALGVHALAGLSPAGLHDAAAGAHDGLLVVSPELARCPRWRRSWRTPAGQASSSPT